MSSPLSHRARKRIREAKKKARPGKLLTIHYELTNLAISYKLFAKFMFGIINKNLYSHIYVIFAGRISVIQPRAMRLVAFFIVGLIFIKNQICRF